MSEAYAYIMPQKDYANLGFFHGSNIAAANPCLEGSGKKLRHIKVHDLKSATSLELRKALVDSIDERRSSLSL